MYIIVKDLNGFSVIQGQVTLWEYIVLENFIGHVWGTVS